MDNVQKYLEKALKMQEFMLEVDGKYESLFQIFEEERDKNIVTAVEELLEGDYLQVVFDDILKAIILKARREHER
jgi:hypothetical protein